MGRGAEQTFFHKTDSQQTHEKMFRSLIIREMQIKTTIRYYLLPVRVTIIKKKEITSIGEDVEKRELSYTVGGNVNWYTHYGKLNGGCSETKNRVAI